MLSCNGSWLCGMRNIKLGMEGEKALCVDQWATCFGLFFPFFRLKSSSTIWLGSDFSKTRLVYRLHNLQTTVVAVMQNPATSAEAKAALRSYGNAITQMINAANI